MEKEKWLKNGILLLTIVMVAEINVLSVQFLMWAMILGELLLLFMQRRLLLNQ